MFKGGILELYVNFSSIILASVDHEALLSRKSQLFSISPESLLPSTSTKRPTDTILWWWQSRFLLLALHLICPVGADQSHPKVNGIRYGDNNTDCSPNEWLRFWELIILTSGGRVADFSFHINSEVEEEIFITLWVASNEVVEVENDQSSDSASFCRSDPKCNRNESVE